MKIIKYIISLVPTLYFISFCDQIIILNQLTGYNIFTIINSVGIVIILLWAWGIATPLCWKFAEEVLLIK